MTAFFFVLNIILFFRLVVFFHDDRLSGREACAAGVALPLILFLLFKPSVPLAVLQLGLLSTVLLSWLGDRSERRTVIRLWVLLLQVIVVGVASSASFGLAFRPQINEALRTWPAYFSPFVALARLADVKAQAYATGFLLCVQEANLVVRWIIELLELKPLATDRDRANTAASNAQEDAAAVAEYNRGRVIGTLERIAVYVLVIHGQYEALGLVLAAKGLARFNNLDDRDFAEYFLIGTFLSVVLAGAIALATNAIS